MPQVTQNIEIGFSKIRKLAYLIYFWESDLCFKHSKILNLYTDTKYLPIYIFCIFLVAKKANSHKMTPFNTARSDSHKTEIFANVSNEYKQTSVTPVITGMFIVFSER